MGKPFRLIELTTHALLRRWRHRCELNGAADLVKMYLDWFCRHSKIGGYLRGRAIAVRLNKHPDPIVIRLGTSDGYIFEEVFLKRVYDVVAELVEGPVRQVVDLGANAGYTVRLWAKLWPQADIVAVEAASENARFAMRNLQFCPKARLRQAFVGKGGERIWLEYSGVESAQHGIRNPTPTAVATEAVSLAQILRETGIDKRKIDLLKCDIEGAERELFADCSDWIGRVRYIVIELHGSYSCRELLAAIERNGGRFSARELWNPINFPLVFLQNEALRQEPAMATPQATMSDGAASRGPEERPLSGGAGPQA